MSTFTDSLRDKWAGISGRERRLVILLGIAVPVVLVIFLGMRISSGMTAIETRNAQLRRALVTVEDLRSRGVTPTSSSGDDAMATIPNEPIDLESYLNSAAEKIGLTIPSFNRQQPVKKNSFIVNSLRIDLRALSIEQLAEFMAAVEGNSKAVAVTSLTVTRNFGDKSKLDLKLDVAAYAHDKPEEAAETAGGEGGS